MARNSRKGCKSRQNGSFLQFLTAAPWFKAGPGQTGNAGKTAERRRFLSFRRVLLNQAAGYGRLAQFPQKGEKRRETTLKTRQNRAFPGSQA